MLCHNVCMNNHCQSDFCQILWNMTCMARSHGFLLLQALLGTYRVGASAGEFIWTPGVLTRAVQEGHWLLLEDIDAAPMDVLSVLLPLLEANTLSVPGHAHSICAHPRFRLFATQR